LTSGISTGSTQNGFLYFGAGRNETIIKASSSATFGFHIRGTSGVSNMTNFCLRDLSIDMTSAANSSSIGGIIQERAYDGMVQNIGITNNSNQYSIILYAGAYTTKYDTCTMTNTLIQGNSLTSDAVTTITFLNCDSSYFVVNYAAICTWIGGAVQSSASTKFQFDTVREMSLFSVDVEGSSDYMSCTSNTISVTSVGNSMGGLTGNYLPSTLPNTSYVFMDGAEQYHLKDGSGYFVVNSTGFGNLSVAGKGSGSTPKLEVSTSSGQSNSAYQAYFHNDFSGTNANGLRTYIAKAGRDAIIASFESGVSSNPFIQLLGSGYMLFAQTAGDLSGFSAPSGTCYLYYDNTAKAFKYITDTGTVKTISAS
jgi:hypothetical protein